jgi:hypothetical protein
MDPIPLGANRDGAQFAGDQAERGLDDINSHPVLVVR